ncbi:MAG: tRNA pseudouridine(38-40) synthase TruA [Clostridia bacterium]|nr:tRNA pseudouridine(38-40) synthase TruA [Clostridia bacterium]
MKTALILSYLGTGYHGWQRQENAMTIQQLLEEAWEKTCGGKAYLSGCGRTDAGVHAKYYVASTDAPTTIPLGRLPMALNARLPEAVVVHKAVAVDDGFDARFSCVCKEYTYLIHNSRTRDPFYTDRAWFYPQKLDVAAMRRAARYFVGTQDFAAVKNEGTPVRSTVRTIFYCEVEERGGSMIAVRVCADGFLYNMVRAITGTLIYVGIGKISSDGIPAILRSRDRLAAGPTAPPCGLYMTALTYNREELDGRAD